MDGEITASANQDKWVARDAFAYYLGYYEDDYTPLDINVPMGVAGPDAWSGLSAHILGLGGTDAPGLYNGNIPLMVTDLKKASIGSSFLGGAIANAYQYDQLNRLKQDRTYHRGGGNWIRASSSRGYWDNQYSYDRNGNIETLSRSVPDLSIMPLNYARTLDNLTYAYTLNVDGKKVDNRLNSVGDLEPVPTLGDPGLVGSIYTYDEIGNLIADLNEKVSQIDWDLHNKVRWVHRAPNLHDLPELKFWYDGTGNRIHKQSITPQSGTAGAPDILHDEWYVRDPQGNEIAVYEQVREDGWLITRLKEHAIYGSDRLGLDLNGVEISRFPIGEDDPEDPTGDPQGRHALVIEEIMYDSPKTEDDAHAGEESNEGEYLVLTNRSGMDLDLGDYTLHVGDDSLGLEDTLPAGQRLILGFGDDAGAFARLVVLPVESMDELVMQSTLPLPDRGEIVSITHALGAEIDAMAYGDFYGLSAENPYLADSLIDSLGQRGSLKYVQRQGSPDAGGGDKGKDYIEPEAGSFDLNRGRKVYECKNHLDNVLAVVSDLKLGISTSSAIDYYKADVVEMTGYEPFGMPLANRHYVSGRYRFGFNGKEHDDEWNGEGNMVDFGVRAYDPRLGRWFAVDPAAESIASSSPYSYCLNSPIIQIDPNGEYPLVVISKNHTGYTFAYPYGKGTTTALIVKTYDMIVYDIDSKGNSTALGHFSVTRESWYDLGQVTNTLKEVKLANGKTETTFETYESIVNKTSEPAEDGLRLKLTPAAGYGDPTSGSYGISQYTSINTPNKWNNWPDGTPIEEEAQRIDNRVSGAEIHVGAVYKVSNEKFKLAGTYGCYGVVDKSQVFGTLEEAQKQAPAYQLAAIKNTLPPGATASNKTMMKFVNTVQSAIANAKKRKETNASQIILNIEKRDPTDYKRTLKLGYKTYSKTQ